MKNQIALHSVLLVIALLLVSITLFAASNAKASDKTEMSQFERAMGEICENDMNAKPGSAKYKACMFKLGAMAVVAAGTYEHIANCVKLENLSSQPQDIQQACSDAVYDAMYLNSISEKIEAQIRAKK